MLDYYYWAVDFYRLRGWVLKFQIDMEKDHYGLTDFDTHTITVDPKMHDWDKRKTSYTILHEIAHASTGLVNHNKRWYNEYRRLSRKYSWRKYKSET